MNTDANSFDDADLGEEEVAPDRIERGHTGTRVLLTLLFAVIWGLAESLLAVIVIFSLVWVLITQRPTPLRLRDFSNRLVAYAYRIWRYITYNDPEVPFPFSDFPPALDPPFDLGHDEAPEVHDRDVPSSFTKR